MQRNFRTPYLTLILVFLISACAAPPSPIATPTLLLTATPTQLPAATLIPTPRFVPTATSAPAALAVTGWDSFSLSALCLEVEQSYPQVENKNFEQPVRASLLKMLAALSVQVLPEDTQDCPVTLTVNIKGSAQSANYESVGTCYTGATISGSLKLVAPGMPAASATINGKRDTSQFVPSASSACSGPQGAPFYDVWPTALVDGMRELWGAPALVAALADPLTRFAASRVLEDLDAEKYADVLVPAYITILVSDDVNAAKAAAIALGQIGEAAAPAVPALIDAMLTAADPVLAMWAVDALFGIGPGATEAVPALLLALDHPDAEVRGLAAHALSAIGDNSQEVIAALIAHTTDSGQSVSMFVMGALNKLTGESFNDASEWQDWWDAQPAQNP